MKKINKIQNSIQLQTTLSLLVLVKCFFIKTKKKTPKNTKTEMNSFFCYIWKNQRPKSQFTRHPMKKIFLPLILTTLCFPLLGLAQTKETQKSKEIPFQAIHISPEKVESCAFGDFDADGHQDIVSGSNWFAGPDFSKAIPFRELRPYFAFVPNSMVSPDDFTLTRDVDGDGFDDIISGGHDMGLFWYKSPGNRNVGNWERILIDADRPPKGESSTESKAHDLGLHNGIWVDIDNDGKKEELVSGGTRLKEGKEHLNLRWYKYENGAWQKYDMGVQSLVWGVGVGDLNKDGRNDVISTDAWFEAPLDPKKGKWTKHPFQMNVCVVEGDFEPRYKSENGFSYGHACNIYVYDINADGLNDFVLSSGHGYGIFWYEQKPSNKVEMEFVEHTIDKSWSLSHNLLFVDMNKDQIPDLLVGKRWGGWGAGQNDANGLYWYQLTPGAENPFSKHIISYGEKIQSFGNSYIRLKYKVNQANSGVYVRGEKGGLYGAYGMQIDFGGEKDGLPMGVTKTIFKFLKIVPQSLKSGDYGQWNTLEIQTEGRHLRTWVNGNLRVDEYVNTQMMPDMGKLAFQLHMGAQDNEVYIKDIEVYVP
ncbi:MAG: hypothetical protein C4K58_00390 [Flavobacteriaceae bacterium]|nr:MAG: hypothetical protein C4K58_00390 [Flavobacteriaceae bacterium]